MKVSITKIVALCLAVALGAAVAWTLAGHMGQGAGGKGKKGLLPAPVEVAEVEVGDIQLERTFSGTLEATAKFVVAPKVSGRVERLFLDFADPVERGQVVAQLDDGEFIQARAQSRADLLVARANLAKAEKGLAISNRELSRVATLLKRGVASDSQYDEAKANQLAGQAQFEVAQAQVARAEAALETANIRLSYTKVTADWTGGDDKRVVAERYVDEGETVAANAPLMSIVELSPITAVIFVAEKDYARLRPGQEVTLTTDAFPEQAFQGRIDRVAPIFKETSRQARVEVVVDNQDQRLKPGMFVRATVVLDRMADAVIVPQEALTKRKGRDGVFVVDETGPRAVWHPVRVGIRQGGRVQVTAPGLSGQVITLGQHLVHDGSPVNIGGGAAR